MDRTKHGESGTRLYNIWKDMRRRCNNPNRKDFHNYGGKGTIVCDEWQESYVIFRDWAKNNGYEEDLSIDRIDSNGNYEPTNCRWITMAEQAKNTKQNIFIEINGETKILSDWCKQLGFNARTVMWRYETGIRGKELFAPKKTTMEGKYHTEKTKKQIGESLKGDKNHNYGKNFSEETRKKMSDAKKGIQPKKTIQFKEEEIKDICAMIKDDKSISSISIKYNVSRKVIYRIKRDYYK